MAYILSHIGPFEMGMCDGMYPVANIVNILLHIRLFETGMCDGVYPIANGHFCDR